MNVQNDNYFNLFFCCLFKYAQQTHTFQITIEPDPSLSVKRRHPHVGFCEASAACRELKLENLLFRQPVSVFGPLLVMYG